MPYYDISLIKSASPFPTPVTSRTNPIPRRLFTNAERARTCNSALTKNPGMFASVNNSTDSTGQIIGYISNAGIPSISNQTVQELDVITPYSVFPLVLLNKAVGLAWWKNIVDGKKMQSKFLGAHFDLFILEERRHKFGSSLMMRVDIDPYGSSESARIDGTATSSFVSWDSKITTVNAILGGVGDFVRPKMKRDGIYDTFITVLQVRLFISFKVRGFEIADKSVVNSESTALYFRVSKGKISSCACQMHRFRKRAW